MTQLFTLILALFIALPVTANDTTTDVHSMPGGIYKLDPNHASLTWKVSHLGLSNYTARFTSFDADILLTPMKLEKSKVRATIDVSSLETDYPTPEKKDFDKELTTNAGWFNAPQFPEIKFMSNKVEITGDNTGKITGDLTFLGVTKPITLDVTFNKALGNHPFVNKPALGFSATASLNRSDFGMKRYLPQIGDKVDIIIEAEFLYSK